MPDIDEGINQVEEVLDGASRQLNGLFTDPETRFLFEAPPIEINAEDKEPA